MKKLLSAIAIITLIATTSKGYAQTENAIAFNFRKAVALSNSGTAKISRTHVSLSALKDFEKSFKKVSDEKWFKVRGGVIANFLSKGVDFRITYDEQGKWLCNLLTYPENRLPSDVRDLVKTRYYDYEIQYCNEYQFAHSSIYVIKMQDDTSVKTVRVADGEMEVIADKKRS
ncbi:MAG: hypothetical protein ACRDE5_12440 [Ginsengibacter sp.]